MPEASPSLLQLPAREAAHRLLLHRFEEWTRTRPRLDDPADAEALHDFRVALRRLRSILRAFRPALSEAIPGKLRRRLRRLADATGASRDLEVQRAWLPAWVATLPARQRRAGRWLLQRLGRLEHEADETLRAEIEKRFEPLRDRLWAALSAPPVGEGENGERATAAAIVARTLRDGSALLRHQLGAVHTIADDPDAHEARIQAKRLRYLLEAFGEEIAAAPPLIERLKQLQDLLGELHDLHRLAETLRGAFRDAAIGRAEESYQQLLPWEKSDEERHREPGTSGAGGLAALARQIRTEAEALFARVQGEWLAGGGSALCDELRTLGDLLEATPEPHVEIERKYLLSGLPPEVAALPAEEIEQGWLPGETLVERLRHVCSAAGEGWFRTVKVGRGLKRIELEEPTSASIFATLWPLTAGCRVRKRRYTIAAGPVSWFVDDFLDRGLVLAEVELPNALAVAEPPEWLRDYVVREVTEEPEYVNRMLAR